MITWSASCPRVNPGEPQAAQIKFIHKHIDNTNQIVLVNIIIQSFGKQCTLAAVFVFDKTLHETLHQGYEVILLELGQSSINTHVFTTVPDTFHKTNLINVFRGIFGLKGAVI